MAKLFLAASSQHGLCDIDADLKVALPLGMPSALLGFLTSRWQDASDTTANSQHMRSAAKVRHENCGYWRQRADRIKDGRAAAKKGRDVVAASPKSGVNTITGEGLADALEGAQVVVDVANAPSFEAKAVLEFFQTSGRNLFAAEEAAGVGHHVALSVVGVDRPRAAIISAPSWPRRICRGVAECATRSCAQTQFFDSGRHAPRRRRRRRCHGRRGARGAAKRHDRDRRSERVRHSDVVGRYLRATGDARAVTADAQAPYFGAVLDDRSLTPGDNPRLGKTRFDDWLSHSKG